MVTIEPKAIEINEKDRLYIGAKFDALLQDMQRNNIDMATFLYESVAFTENLITVGKLPKYSPGQWMELVIRAKTNMRISIAKTLAELEQQLRERQQNEKR
jgi:hypothetical protein